MYAIIHREIYVHVCNNTQADICTCTQQYTNRYKHRYATIRRIYAQRDVYNSKEYVKNISALQCVPIYVQVKIFLTRDRQWI